MDLADFRSQFPITAERTYLFAGALAPASLAARAAADSWLDAWSLDPTRILETLRDELEALRTAFAELIGAHADEIVVTDGTSRAASIAARILSSQPGDIVADDTTYPSSIYPWLATNRQVTMLPTGDTDDPTLELVELLARKEPVGVVAVSHVGPFTGRRHRVQHLAEVVHAQGGLLFVDAAQSTGAIPVDVHRDGIDILVTTAMKWLLGPPGIGFLYIRRELLEDAPPVDVGYFGARPPAGWPRTELPPFAEGGRKFEPGMPSLPGLAAATAGIGLIQAVGIEQIHRRIEGLVSRCIHELRARGLVVRTPELPETRAGVIVPEHPRATELVAFLRDRRIDIGGYPAGFLRIDPHAFCTDDDIDQFLAGLDAFESGTSSSRDSEAD